MTFSESCFLLKHISPFQAKCCASRLDRWYIQECLISKVAFVDHIASLSDHCAVRLDLNLEICRSSFNVSNNSQTYWKLNARILKDEDFLPNFSTFWLSLQTLKAEHSDIADWWDAVVKPRIRKFYILFSRQRSQKRKSSRKFWLA